MSSSNISNTNRIMATSASSWHHRHQQKQPRHGSIGSNFSISNIKVEAMQWPWQHRHQRRWLLQPLLNLIIINIGGGNIIINNGSNDHIQPLRLRQHHQHSRSDATDHRQTAHKGHVPRPLLSHRKTEQHQLVLPMK